MSAPPPRQIEACNALMVINFAIRHCTISPERVTRFQKLMIIKDFCRRSRILDPAISRDISAGQNALPHCVVGPCFHGFPQFQRRKHMTAFEEREKTFENKFALDQELKFKVEARRNKLLGEWAAAKLDLSGAAVGEYIRELSRIQVILGNDEVFRKLMSDLECKGVAVSAYELRKMSEDFLASARKEIKESR
jgi:hypothetical protein